MVFLVVVVVVVCQNNLPLDIKNYIRKAKIGYFNNFLLKVS